VPEPGDDLVAQVTVRPATAGDRDALAAFRCRTTERKHDLEVERLIQQQVLDHALETPADRRLLVFEDEDDEIVAVAEHEHGETTMGSSASHLLVVAIALGSQGKSVAHATGDKPEKLWRRVMSELVGDVVGADRGSFVYAVTHRKNAKALHMLREFGMRKEIPLVVGGQRIDGYLTMLGRLP
jgi:hypothetical protein